MVRSETVIIAAIKFNKVKLKMKCNITNFTEFSANFEFYDENPFSLCEWKYSVRKSSNFIV